MRNLLHHSVIRNSLRIETIEISSGGRPPRSRFWASPNFDSGFEGDLAGLASFREDARLPLPGAGSGVTPPSSPSVYQSSFSKRTTGKSANGSLTKRGYRSGDTHRFSTKRKSGDVETDYPSGVLRSRFSDKSTSGSTNRFYRALEFFQGLGYRFLIEAVATMLKGLSTSQMSRRPGVLPTANVFPSLLNERLLTWIRDEPR